MRSNKVVFTILMVALGIAALLSLSVGTSNLGPFEILTGVLKNDPTTLSILRGVRVPHTGFSLLIGATLGLVGAIFQSLFRNPLADPYILGVSGGAALGATVSIAILGSLPWMGAGIGSLMVIVVISFIAGWAEGRAAGYVVLLAGVMINSFCGAIILGLRSVISAQKSQEILFYLVGTLSSVENLEAIDLTLVLFVTLFTLLLSLFFAKDLDLLLLGDQEAKSLGSDPNRVRLLLIIICSLAVAVAVSFTGLIGFVGLVAPHLVRIWIGPRHRALLPLAAMAGALFLCVADTVARVSFHAFETTLPVGAVTAIVGAPIFLAFLKMHMRSSHG